MIYFIIAIVSALFAGFLIYDTRKNDKPVKPIDMLPQKRKDKIKKIVTDKDVDKLCDELNRQFDRSKDENF